MKTANGARKTPDSTPQRPSPPRAAKSNSKRTEGDGDALDQLNKDALVSAFKALQNEHEDVQAKLNEERAALSDLVHTNQDLNSRVNTMASDFEAVMASQARESELAAQQQATEDANALLKEAERGRRDLERRLKQETEDHQQNRAAWQGQEDTLKARILKLKADLKNLRDRHASRESLPEEQEEEEEPLPHVAPHVASQPTHVDVPSRETSLEPDISKDILAGVESDFYHLQSSYDELLLQHTALAATHNKLQDQLTELQTVNKGLMDESESFQLLLGERTLNGEILEQGVFGRDWDRDYQTTRRQPLRQLSENTRDPVSFESHGTGTGKDGSVGAAKARRSPKGDRFIQAPTSGLDLATELERAQEEDERVEEESIMVRDMPAGNEETLRREITALRDANKALALYAERIVERIIGVEGFEKVLAHDYTKSPDYRTDTKVDVPPPANKRMSFDMGAGAAKLRSSLNSAVAFPQAPEKEKTSEKPAEKKNRLSFSISSFWSSSGPKSPPLTNPNLKPMLLTSQNVLKKQPEDEDDEEDARERARLNAEMKLMGIEDPGSPGLRSLAQQHRTISSALNDRSRPERSPSPPNSTMSRRSSLRTSVHSPRLSYNPNAHPSLAALESMSAIEQRDADAAAALKQGRATGFTEIRRVGDRRKSSRGSSSIA